ncbi:MAG TPA: endonuclease/exonuclease/phosphatase family protein, partial [Pyrinomonadaceae bacterium]
GLMHKMGLIRNSFRLFIGWVLVSTMILFNVTKGGAQQPGRNGEPLLESGRAEKLLPPGGTSKDLKIVSYNIRWRAGKELQEIAHWLKSSEAPAPSIIGLQEVDRAKKRTGCANNAKALAESLGMYYAWAAPHSPEKGKTKEEETGVVLLSPYPLADITRLVLTNDGPGGRSRVALGATIKIGKTPVRVYSVHAETRLPLWQKIDQLRVVLDDLAKFPKATPAIVLGDFNAWELPTIDAVRKLFTEAGFTTPVPDDESTYARKVLGFEMKLKLDWIWVHGMIPQAYGIDRGLKVSDHFPVWAVVKLPAD